MCQTGELESHVPSFGSNGNTSGGDFGKHETWDKFIERSRFSPSSIGDYQKGCAYRSDPCQEKSSLSMRLMHRPSRAQKEYEKASDPTKENSRYNAFVNQDHSSDSLSSPETPFSQDEQDSSREISPVVYPARLSLVRKKSGEIVKPLLKATPTPVGVRSLSLPSTPTDKQVHFGGDNDVRYFKKKDRPDAISAQGSPRHFDYDDEDEDIPSLECNGCSGSLNKSYFEYYDDEFNSHADVAFAKDTVSQPEPSAKASLCDWILTPLNLTQGQAPSIKIQKGKQVFLENLFLSGDKRCLLGMIAVHNLAFQKSVFVRYSIDKWSTVVEIQAKYIADTPTGLKTLNYDRFMFSIPLDSFCNGFHRSVDPTADFPIHLSTEMCVRYLCNDQEMWDNNDGKNYLFNLQRKKEPVLASPKITPVVARAKQEAHEKKPKYSSTYLKRIKSDSSISNQMCSSTINSKAHSTKHSEKARSSTTTDTKSYKPDSSRDDFENNDFYLSSPLLSNLSSKDQSENLREMTSCENVKQSSSRNYMSSATTQSEQQSAPRNFSIEGGSRKFNSDNKSGVSPLSKDLQEPMSYKAFLDSYCFFNSSLHDNDSKNTLVLNDEPCPTSDENTQINCSSDAAYTVSSFLT